MKTARVFRKSLGFTLIELLSVILILALISLIATPIIIGTIDQAKKDVFANSAYGMVEAASVYYTKKLTSPGSLFTSVTFSIQNNEWSTDELLEVNGELPDSGVIKIDKDGRVSLALIKGDWCATKGFAEKKVSVSDEIANCNLKDYSEAILNGAEPEVTSNMIPVVIENNGVVKKADTGTKWYDYSNKRWANVVTVTSDTRGKYSKAAIGTEIREEDILTYLVWIPRYKYQIWNANGNDTSQPRSIRIQFENINDTTSKGVVNGSWLTHPAFCAGTYDENTGNCDGRGINGFWVGKFETGYRQNDNMSNTSSWTPNASLISTVDSNKILVKPLIPSWRNINVSNIYETVSGMTKANNVYGFTSYVKSHMMKNNEWGAVAYLANSVYGTNKLMRSNNNNNFMTGCTASSEVPVSSSSCEHKYYTETGVLSSTTGNVTGIYDMAGGSYEYVMGYTEKANPSYGSSGFLDFNFPSKKFINIYKSVSSSEFTLGYLGDATKELRPINGSTSSWYDDGAQFVSSIRPWFTRGGSYAGGASSGIFNFENSDGAGNSNTSFRIVIYSQDI